MFDGDLYASPRPALPHANAASALLAEIHKSFHRKDSGGWAILYEPELHFGRDVLVPDLVGWRRARLASVPAAAYLTLAPDWVCEVLSASTEPLDRGARWI
jgi:Uma2 family endonuclease